MDGFREFADGYLDRFAIAIRAMDRDALARVAEVLSHARAEGRQVFVAGNGGSASLADHFECDATKGTDAPGRPPLRTRSLSANAAVLTATANDLGYDAVFERQLAWYGRPGDVAILVSTSGKSANIVRACRSAKESGIFTVALVGFDGGDLAKIADLVLHVPVENCGMSEDALQCAMHLVTQYIARNAG